MTIVFECSSCGQRLKLPDPHPGRTVTCPKCRAKVEVPWVLDLQPGTLAQASPVSGSGEWHLHREGTTYGPYPFEQLRLFAGQGLILPTDQIQFVGSNEWKAAKDLFQRNPSPARSVPPPLPCQPPRDNPEHYFAGLEQQQADQFAEHLRGGPSSWAQWQEVFPGVEKASLPNSLRFPASRNGSLDLDHGEVLEAVKEMGLDKVSRRIVVCKSFGSLDTLVNVVCHLLGFILFLALIPPAVFIARTVFGVKNQDEINICSSFIVLVFMVFGFLIVRFLTVNRRERQSLKNGPYAVVVIANDHLLHIPLVMKVDELYKRYIGDEIHRIDLNCVDWHVVNGGRKLVFDTIHLSGKGAGKWVLASHIVPGTPKKLVSCFDCLVDE